MAYLINFKNLERAEDSLRICQENKQRVRRNPGHTVYRRKVKQIAPLGNLSDIYSGFRFVFLPTGLEH